MPSSQVKSSTGKTPASRAASFLKVCVASLRCSVFERALCRACRRAADSNDPDTRAAGLHAAHPEPFGCERYPLSPDGPGSVDHEERLYFLLTRPGAIDKVTGELLPQAAKQLVKGGLSVLRENASDDEILATFSEMKRASESKGRTREFLGVSTFTARDARHGGNGTQFLGVFATGLPGRPHHADVAAPQLTPAEGKEAVAHMRGLIEAGRQGLPEFRSGTLTGIT